MLVKDRENVTRYLQSIVHYQGKSVKALVSNPEEHAQVFWLRGEFYEVKGPGMLNKVWEMRDLPGPWVDIGASIGNHTLFFSLVCGKRTIAIEPSVAFDHLRHNVAHNDAPVDLYHVAVGDYSGRCSIEQHYDVVEGKRVTQEGMRRVNEDGDDTEMMRLDDVLAEVDPGLIKIDVEFYNAEVLRGAEDVLTRCSPKVFIECPDDESLEETEDIMSGYGYTREPGVWNYTPTYLWSKNA